MLPLVLGYFIFIAGMSLISFAVYAWDKWRAKRDGFRVPEKRLHLLALCGGWPGALLGQRILRHKTRKTSFLMVFWLCVACHLAIVATIAYVIVSSSSAGS